MTERLRDVNRLDAIALIRETFRDLNERSWLPYESWERVLRAALVRDPKTGKRGFGGIFGPALAARAEWLKESRDLGLPPAEAERRFKERIDKDHAKQQSVEQEAIRIRTQAAQSKTSSGRVRGEEAQI